MKITSEHIWLEDDEWWYHTKRGTRVRCTVGTCEFCGEEFARYPNPDQRHCSRLCTQRCRFQREDLHPETAGAMKHKRHPGWKGGRIRVRGYVLIWAPDHPSLAGTKRKYVAEHRLVMEKKLGRYLRRDENVHHKNGVKDDNRLRNLELWTVPQPPGQRQSQAPAHCATCTCFTSSAA